MQIAAANAASTDANCNFVCLRSVGISDRRHHQRLPDAIEHRCFHNVTLFRRRGDKLLCNPGESLARYGLIVGLLSLAAAARPDATRMPEWRRFRSRPNTCETTPFRGSTAHHF